MCGSIILFVHLPQLHTKKYTRAAIKHEHRINHEKKVARGSLFAVSDHEAKPFGAFQDRHGWAGMVPTGLAFPTVPQVDSQ